MRRNSSTPKFPIPSPLTDIHVATDMIEREKAKRQFDEFFAKIIISRSHRYPERTRIIDLLDVIVPQVMHEINPEIIFCIFSTDPLYNHNLRVPKSTPYKREDHVERLIRSIVEHVYPEAHKEFIRQKTKGCMITIHSKSANIRLRVG